VGIPKNILILGVGDVEKIPSMHDINDVLVVDIQILELENIPGSNGIHKCKN
jgi:hypothetical protein